MWEQVEILYYEFHKQNAQFIVELKTTRFYDELILARIDPKYTLLETYNKACDLIENSRNEEYEFSTNDELMVPAIDFDIKRVYSELIGTVLREFKLPCVDASQIVKFRLDEKGTRLESEAELIFLSLPKKLIFDEPFLVFLREKGKELPYFIAWIQDDYLLAK